MNEESKIAIVTHGDVVDFNPDNVEHQKILQQAHRAFVQSDLEIRRQCNMFIGLVEKWSTCTISSYSAEKDLENFFKLTGVRLTEEILEEAASNCQLNKLDDLYKKIRQDKLAKPEDSSNTDNEDKHIPNQVSVMVTDSDGIVCFRDFNNILPGDKAVTASIDPVSDGISERTDSVGKETKVVISSDGVVVDFNPNDAEHKEALKKANTKLTINELKFRRKLKLFEDLISKVCFHGHNTPLDITKECADFTKSTGVGLSSLRIIKGREYSLHGKLESYLKELLDMKKVPVSSLKVGDTVKSCDGKDIPIVAIHTHLPQGFVASHAILKSRDDFSGAPEAELPSDHTDEKEKTFCSDLQLLADSLETLSSKNVISGHGYADVKKVLLGAFNNKNGTKIDITEFTKLIKKEATSSELYHSVLDKDTVCRIMFERMKSMHPKEFSKKRHDELREVLELAYSRSQNIERTALNELRHGANSKVDQFKRNYGINFSVVDMTEFLNGNMSINGLLDKYVRVVEKKEVNSETYQLIELHLKGMRYDHILVKPVTREYISGVIKTFKDMFFIEFSYKDLARFFTGIITVEELLLLYVKLPEKKIKMRSEYNLCLSLLVSLLSLFNPSRIDHESIERAKLLVEQLNIRFDINITEGDFLDIIYRRSAPSHILKKYATTEATKGE